MEFSWWTWKNSLDDSTEEGELKGVCTLESKLKFNAAKGVMFASRYLLKMITDGNICSEYIVAVEAYLIWMTLSSTIRFYMLRPTIYCNRYSWHTVTRMKWNSFSIRRRLTPTLLNTLTCSSTSRQLPLFDSSLNGSATITDVMLPESESSLQSISKQLMISSSSTPSTDATGTISVSGKIISTCYYIGVVTSVFL